METDWHTINIVLYDKYCTREQNIQKGVDLPIDDEPVLLYDTDKKKYFVGRIHCSEAGITITESVHGEYYSGYPIYLRWSYFKPYKEVKCGQ